MARNETEVTIGPDGGRDAGKVYHITEMDAFQCESWTHRAGIVLAKAGIDLLQLAELDMESKEERDVGILMLLQGLGGLNYTEVKPLLDEQFSCVKIKPSEKVIRALTGQGDIEEFGTLNRLRMEVVKLHLDFWRSAFPSKSTSGQSAPAAPKN